MELGRLIWRKSLFLKLKHELVKRIIYQILCCIIIDAQILMSCLSFASFFQDSNQMMRYFELSVHLYLNHNRGSHKMNKAATG